MTTPLSTFNPQLTAAFPKRLVPLCDGRPGLRATLQTTVRAPDPAGPVPLPGAPPAPQPSTLNPQPVLDFIASDETLDRCDEVIAADGWRLEHYRRNPVFQNAHQYGDILFTLGKALITEVRAVPPATLNQQPAAFLYQRIEFAVEANPLARIAYRLYAGKFLNAVSVGFIPLRWQDADAQQVGRGVPAVPPSGRLSTLNAQPATQPFRRKYLEQELLEVSAVGIPANPNALALGLKAGAIEKSDLRETLELLRLALDPAPAHPQPLVPDRKVFNPQLLLALARDLRAILRHS
jgi:hypothetical protein